MRKFTMKRDTQITKELIASLIKKHKVERDRILNMKEYYSGSNIGIAKRSYTDKNKPSNRLYSGYASYITDSYVGYFLGHPVSYSSKNEALIEYINGITLYNDDADNNTTLVQDQSICGYAYEILYRDEDAEIRYRSVDTEDMIVVQDNTLEENILFAVRLCIDNNVDKDGVEEYGSVVVYTKDTTTEYVYEDGEIGALIDVQDNFFTDVPVVVYENNRQRLGDFERVISLIDAYDNASSDTANDFEYFTNALLVVSGTLIEEVDEQGRPLNFKDNRVLNFTEGDAKYLTKDINDTALENYKNRLNNDIHKFSNVLDVNDSNFGGNLSGVAMRYKLQGMENLTTIKESKFKKGLQRRLELILTAPGTASVAGDYREITPVFTRNIPSNEVETVDMIQKLQGMVSDKTLLEQIPFIVSDVAEELELLKEQGQGELDKYNM